MTQSTPATLIPTKVDASTYDATNANTEQVLTDTTNKANSAPAKPVEAFIEEIWQGFKAANGLP